MPMKVLIAMDGSEHAKRALNWYAGAYASRPEDTLVFLYVAEPPSFSPSLSSPELYAGAVNNAVAHGRILAAEVKAACAKLGLASQAVFLERLTHGPGPAIVDVADEENVDLILMGSRGSGLLRRTIIGSVSDYVLHHAHRPTIIVPPPPPQPQPPAHAE